MLKVGTTGKEEEEEEEECSWQREAKRFLGANESESSVLV
jgi:hypothetical protein